MENVAIHAVGLDPAMLERVERGLAEERAEFSVTASGDVDAALDALATEPADCVVCAPNVREPGLLGFQAQARDRGIDAPFVLFDGQRAALLDGFGEGDGRGGDTAPSLEIEEATDFVASIEAAIGSDTARDPDAVGSLPIAPERLRQFLKALDDPVFVVDEDRRFAVVNGAMEEYADIDRDTMEGSPVDELVREESIDSPDGELEALRAGAVTKTTLELSFRTKGGEERVAEVKVSALTDENGDYAGSVGILRDVTERVERERRLAQYRSFLETAPIGMFAIDPDGVIIWCNEQWVKDMDQNAEDLVGLKFRELVEEGYFALLEIDEYLDAVRHLLSSDNDEDRIVYEVEWTNADGRDVVSEVHIGLLPLEDGEFTGTVQAFREVTEERRYRQELERQNRRLENFASFVSHDLRNPLNVAKGYLDLIAEDTDDERVEELGWSLDRMEELIGDLLTLAREGKTIGETEPVSLAAIARESWDAVDTPGATLEVEDDVTIDADPDRLRSLFENLFRNSIEHGIEAGDGGAASAADEPVLTVTVGPLGLPDPQRDEAEAPTEAIGFYVADDGTGLPTDEDGAVDQSLFEVGYTTNESGTGFGMGIVEEIVDAHDWSITAGESEAGGALFEVRDVRPAHVPRADDTVGE